jgi:diguanylate cyclase (GGDEF)-like protein/PAS domain S-box-containing protein
MAGHRAWIVAQLATVSVASVGLLLLGFGLGRQAEAGSGNAFLGEPGAALSAVSLISAVIALLYALDRQSALRRIRASEQSYRNLYENISEGVFRSTLDGRMLSANPSLVRLNGYQTEQQLLTAVDDIATEWYVDPGRRAEINAELAKSGRVSNFRSEIYRHGTRERIWIEENIRLVRSKDGQPLFYEGTIREVTDLVKRLELQEHYDTIVSIMSGFLYQFRMARDGSFSVPYASVGLVSMLGIQPEAVKRDAAPIISLIHPEDRAAVVSSVIASAENLQPWQCEYRAVLPGGEEKWIFGHSVPVREADGSTLWHGFLTDVSDRKYAQARVHELAYFDPLTRLPNRTMLRDALGQALSASGRNGQRGAVLFIDLDHFKTLNDTKGHHVGDLLLTEMAGRIRARVRQGDTVARHGGDEFVVLLRDLGTEAARACESAQLIATQVLAAVSEPYVRDDHSFQTTASIGVAVFSGAGEDVDHLLKNADLAMYAAKSSGRGAVCFFEPTMQADMEHRLALASDLKAALNNDDLELFYQAQVNRAGRTVGAEALLRWNHPQRGWVPPEEIISVAERSGFIGEVDDWVLRRACLTLASWRAVPATRALRLAVNISGRQLNRERVVAHVKRALAESGADPRSLTLELTEHVMLENVDGVVAAMTELNLMGVRFALDDFGTGYSSLSYLKQLPIESMKIDRSFVRDIETDPSDRAIIRTIVGMARSLGVLVVGEGVETETQALLLRQLGCDAFQGYLFGRPVPLDAFLARLEVSGVDEAGEAELPVEATA